MKVFFWPIGDGTDFATKNGNFQVEWDDQEEIAVQIN